MKKIWQTSYEPGVPLEINPDQYSSIPELLGPSFQRFAKNPCFTNFGTTLTYEQIHTQALQFAAYLQKDLGHKPGDRIAIMLPNTLQYPICLLGALWAGLTVVNVNPLYTARELQYQLQDAGVETLVIFANAAHMLEKIRAQTPVKNVITTQVGDLLSFPKNHIINFVLKKIKKMVPDYQIPDEQSLRSVLTKRKSSEFTPVSIKASDPAFLQYTGGTTGVSKGAILTHRNMISNLLQARSWLTNLVEEGREVIITALPLYHIFSLTANCFTFSFIGGHNILITNPKDIPAFIKELRKWKFTAITGVNTLFRALMNDEGFTLLDFSSLKMTLGGGMAVQKAVADEWQQKTKVPLIEAYGLTETSPAACMNPMNLKQFNGCIGIPISSTDVRILDDSGQEVPAGQPGEICIRGPQVMAGYWQKPEETAKVMTPDGFFKTGDIGLFNEQGFIRIMDRKKDMILVSGFNVYPNEVEDVLVSHPGVLEAAVIGVPSEASGEVVKAFVVKRDPNLSADEVIRFAREQLTAYKVPRSVEFRESLPKSNVGKILRKELRG